MLEPRLSAIKMSSQKQAPGWGNGSMGKVPVYKCGDQTSSPQKPHKACAVVYICNAHISRTRWELETGDSMGAHR